MNEYQLEKPSEVVPLLDWQDSEIARYQVDLRKSFKFMLENPEEMREGLFIKFNQDALMAALEQTDMEDIARFILVLAMYYREAQE